MDGRDREVVLRFEEKERELHVPLLVPPFGVPLAVLVVLLLGVPLTLCFGVGSSGIAVWQVL